MIWDLSCQNTLFWVRMNGHCLVSWELCLYDGSLETVGQFCQNKNQSQDTSWDHSPGRTKTGVVPWRCRNVKTKHSVTRPAQEIRSKELCSLLDQKYTLNFTKNFCSHVQNAMYHISVTCILWSFKGDASSAAFTQKILLPFSLQLHLH